MSTVNIPNACRAAKRTRSYARNGNLIRPNAEFHAFLEQEANRIASLRVKSWNLIGAMTPFTAPTWYTYPVVGTPPTERVRWRFAMHTSTHCDHMLIHGAFKPISTVGYATVVFVPVGGGTTVTTQIDFGLDAGIPVLTTGPDDLDFFQVPTAALVADTAYEVKVSDNYGSRLVSMSISEVSKAADTANGYLGSAISNGAPILDEHRELITEMLRAAWISGAAPLWTFAPYGGGITRTSATVANLTDQTLTGAPTVAWPGAYLQLAHHSTERRVTVPCVFKAYGSCANVGNGHVYLTDASGNDLGDIEIDSSTPGWFTTTQVDLPATDAWYYLRVNGNGADLLTVDAVSLYQYEA